MGELYVARDPNRFATMLPLGGTRKAPNVLIPFYGLDRAEMDNMIRAVCAKHGLTEKETELLVETAEEQYEYRMKVKEASAELRYRVAEQARYPKLKWGGLRPVRKRY